MKPLPRHGVVSLSVLDVRRRPDHKAEMCSQLLLGETVRVLGRSRDGGWWKVRNDADSYVGWVRTWGVCPAGVGRVRRWRALARGRIVVPFTEVRAPEGQSMVAPLVWNSRVIVRRSSNGRVRVELPDGRTGSVPRGVLETRPRRWAMLRRIRTLLGTPYLWGGRSAFGFDCSGWTQQVLMEQGMRLPRDAHEQYRATRRLGDATSLRSGDLVFFGLPRNRVSHVGICLGGGYYSHCRGVVRINSVDPDNALYDKQLVDQIRGFGRPDRGRA